MQVIYYYTIVSLWLILGVYKFLEADSNQLAYHHALSMDKGTPNRNNNDSINMSPSDEPQDGKDHVPPIFYVLINSLMNQQGNQEETSESSESDQSANSDQAPPVTERVTFDQVRGQPAVKEEVAELTDFLKNPEKYKKFGAKVPKGILLHGVPGTGKTLIARAIAGEAGCLFFHASASSFVDRFVGMGAFNLRKIFDQAREALKKNHDTSVKSAIIFLDEIDAIGGVSRGSPNSSEEYRQTLNELLHQMDGFSKDENIIVIAATNTIDLLDKALLRPGRFTRVVEVTLPTRAGREDILGYYLDKTHHLEENPNKVATRLAGMTMGWSGADLENLVNEAAILAARENSRLITRAHFDRAWDKIILGLALPDAIRTPEQRKKTAYHEAGHTLVRMLCGMPVSKVTIMPRGRTLGVTRTIPKHETLSDYSYEELLHEIMVAQGGFVAEELALGTVHPGACSDLEKANHYASIMINEFGMGNGALRGVAGSVFGSPALRGECDTQIQLLLGERLIATRALLSDNFALLGQLASELLARETLDEQELIKLFPHITVNSSHGGA